MTNERIRSHGEVRRYMLYSLPLAMFGAVLMWAYTETAEGAAIGFAVLSVDGLIVVVATRLWGGARPRREAANLDDIYLMRAELLTEEHPMLHFEVSSRAQYGSQPTTDVRVAVPPGRETEAEALAERYPSEFGLSP